MNRRPDLLIVGAGPVGCVIAERAAVLRQWTSVIVDRRSVAGNCHDRLYDNGVLVHQYGPHYFRTERRAAVGLSFAVHGLDSGELLRAACHEGELYPMPINLLTLGKFFKREFSEATAREFLEQIREKIAEPRNSEEFALSRVGRQLYEAFYLGYTLKQWGIHPRDLDASVCGRIPVRFNADCRYVDHVHQVTPAAGFTVLFANMLRRPEIEVCLSTPFAGVRGRVEPRVATVYCGQLDEYFDCRLGPLPWRSLEFQWRVFEEELHQPCVQINYPNDHAYTRSVEIKHVTGQKHPETVVSYEFPQAVGEPYYPVPAPASRQLCEQYRRLAAEETAPNRVYFCGRLAEYKYINMDEAVESASGSGNRSHNCQGPGNRGLPLI